MLFFEHFANLNEELFDLSPIKSFLTIAHNNNKQLPLISFILCGLSFLYDNQSLMNLIKIAANSSYSLCTLFEVSIGIVDEFWG